MLSSSLQCNVVYGMVVPLGCHCPTHDEVSMGFMHPLPPPRLLVISAYPFMRLIGVSQKYASILEPEKITPLPQTIHTYLRQDILMRVIEINNMLSLPSPAVVLLKSLLDDWYKYVLLKVQKICTTNKIHENNRLSYNTTLMYLHHNTDYCLHMYCGIMVYVAVQLYIVRLY